MSVKSNACDEWFSKAIRRRDGDRCRHCNTHSDVNQIQCAHLVGRRSAQTRWDPDNAVALCASCHRWFTEHPKMWTDWIECELPGIWDTLYERFNTRAVKNTKETKKAVSDFYREQYRSMELNGDLASWYEA